MQRFFTGFLLLIFFASCGDNNDTSSVLSAQPYTQLTDSIDRFPENADLYYRRGSLLFINQQNAYAETDLRKAWELQPTEEHALRLTTVLKQRSADDAIAFLEAAVKKIPGNVSLQIGLARGYQQKKQNAKALAICEDIIQHYPGQLDALALKSELLKDENKDDESIVTLEKAYRLSPGDVELVHQLAFAYADSKNPKVLALADSLIKLDLAKRHAEPYYFKGLYYENTGHYADAIKFFDEAIRHDYNFLDAYMDKGQVLYDEKKYDAAYQSFQLAAIINAAYADAWYWMGKTMEAKGKKEEARLNYERAYGLDKTITEAKEGMERMGKEG